MADETGAVTCFGHNGWGQLGIGKTNGYNKTKDKADVGKMKALVVGTCASSSFAADNKLGVVGMGFNLHMTLAANSTGLKNAPVPAALDIGGKPVFGIANPAVAIDGGDGHACALGKDGKLWCWGDTEFSQTGSGTTGASKNLPNPYKVKSNVARFSAGADHNCLVTKDGEGLCWGRNNKRQVGAKQTASYVAKPTAPSSLPAVVDMCAGLYHNCAVAKNGDVYCWGDNQYGQLGSYPGTLPTGYAKQAKDAPKSVRIACGTFHTCVIAADGEVYCWGRNNNGQLGSGKSVDKTHLPAKVVKP